MNREPESPAWWVAAVALVFALAGLCALLPEWIFQ